MSRTVVGYFYSDIGAIMMLVVHEGLAITPTLNDLATLLFLTCAEVLLNQACRKNASSSSPPFWKFLHFFCSEPLIVTRTTELWDYSCKVEICENFEVMYLMVADLMTRSSSEAKLSK